MGTMEPDDEYDVLVPSCPSRVVLGRIGDRWTLLVFHSLKKDVLRFGDLRAKMGSPAPKVLSQTLQALVRDGLVAREQFPVIPPRVEYRLTPLGLSLLEPIEAIRRWSETHTAEILTARRLADEAALS